MPDSEVQYACRRADGEPIGDFSFLTVDGPDDWSVAEDDADGSEQAADYEIVKMTIDVAATKTVGNTRAVCDEWVGKTYPVTERAEIIVGSLSEDTWPARDMTLTYFATVAEAEGHVDGLPETFFHHTDFGAYLIARSQLRVEAKTIGGWKLDCDTCGHRFYEHEDGCPNG